MDWRDQAKCRGYNPEMWWTEDEETTTRAQNVCLRCPVVAECLDYAVKNHEDYGVWGALTPKGRRLWKQRLAHVSHAK